MRKIRDVLRLKYACHLTERKIAESCGLARSTVADYLKRAEKAGLNWPLPELVSDQELENRLFTVIPAILSGSQRPPPDYDYIYNELRDYKNVNLTLSQLWIEYKEHNTDGYQYSQFCENYRRWRKKLDYCMRQEHKAGEKVFVDYAKGLSIVNPKTGELIPTELFVAVWGASNFTFAEASLSQESSCWIKSHTHAFSYFGCVPHIIVPDCLKAGVTDACFYEPEINPAYADMAEHYGACVLPARPRHPRDKAKVETGVLIVKRWILSVLRHRTFTSLAEMNMAIKEQLEILNNRPLRKLKQSRRTLFESLDLPNALTLPSQPCEYAEWKKVTVNIDYHVAVSDHYYSVPFHLVGEKLDARFTSTTVELIHKGERVIAHARSYVRHGYTTLPEHMPPEHRKYAEWTPSRMIRWASQTGPATAELVKKIISDRAFPEQGYRACLGVLRMGKHYGQERLEAAAMRALQFNTCSFRSVRRILSQGLDRQADAQSNTGQAGLPFHDNVRGGEYFH